MAGDLHEGRGPRVTRVCAGLADAQAAMAASTMIVFVLVLALALAIPLPGARASASASAAPSAVEAGSPPESVLLRDLRRIYASGVDVDPAGLRLLALAGGAVILVDQDVYDWVHSGPADPGLDQWSETITDLGLGTTSLGISGLIALGGDLETGYLAANAVVYSGISCALLKAAFGRARPDVGDGPRDFAGPGIRAGYDSMPSGHTAAAFALATVLARRYPKYKALFYAGATLVAASRVYERAHWPSDTVVGAAIGIWSANQVMTKSRLFQVTW